MKKPSCLLIGLLSPGIQSQSRADLLSHQRYDYAYQVYQEEGDRIRVESHYVRGEIDITDATQFRFQWLNDAISGASPTGALPGGEQPFLAELEDVRTGVLGALSQQIGNHRVELEVSHSEEDDYVSRGYSLTDTIEFNEKNTSLTIGLNYLDDTIKVVGLGDKKKESFDFFAGVTQIINKNTFLSMNLTLGSSEGYLNDQYKVV